MLILKQRLISLDDSFASFESKAESFQGALTRQAEMQAHFLDEIQNDMNVTREFLNNITSDTANLHSTFQNTINSFDQVASLLNKLPGATGWISTVIWISLLLFALSPKITLRAAALICQPSPECNVGSLLTNYTVCTIILKARGVFDVLLSITSSGGPLSTILPSNAYLSKLLVVALVFAIVLAIRHSTNIISLLRPRQLDITSNRPNLDMEKCNHASCGV